MQDRSLEQIDKKTWSLTGCFISIGLLVGIYVFLSIIIGLLLPTERSELVFYGGLALMVGVGYGLYSFVIRSLYTRILIPIVIVIWVLNVGLKFILVK